MFAFNATKDLIPPHALYEWNYQKQTLGVVIKDWRDTRQVQLSLSDLMQATGVQSKIDAL